MKISRLFYTLTLLALVSLMSACSQEPVFTPSDSQNATGGGGAVSTTPPISLSVSITLKDGSAASSNDITTISPGNPGYLTFLVLDQNGAPAPNQIVQVSTTLATVSPTSFLTDSAGKATALLEYNSTNGTGADTLSANVTLDSVSYSATKNYAVASTGTSVTSSLSISLTLKNGPAASDTDVTDRKSVV